MNGRFDTTPAVPYQVVYTRHAHAEKLSHPIRLQRIVESVVENELPTQATLETRNRFVMRPNPKAAWEQRRDPVRLYYDVDEQRQVVTIKGVVEKVGSEIRVHGRLMDLDEYLAA